jgi:hypothetical protein
VRDHCACRRIKSVVDLLHLPTRSGVSDAEVAAAMPGDDLVPDATDVIDRATTLPVGPEVVWPWLAQLGKGRTGWYLPRRVEMLLPRHGLRRIDPSLQRIAVGDDIPDWGPGEPVFRAVVVDAPRALVWHSLRDRSNEHRWPADPSAAGILALSWALVLRPVANGTRLHLRLRLRVKHPVLAKLGGLFDWLTIVLLFRGLRERVSSATLAERTGGTA